MHIHTHHHFRSAVTHEARLLRQTGSPPPGPTSGPERINPTNAPRIIASTRESLARLQSEITNVESSQSDEAMRAATLQGIHSELEALKSRIVPETGPTLPDAEQERQRAELKTQAETMHQTLGERIQRLRALATNSVYQLFRSTGLGGPLRWFGGLFTGLGPIFRDIGSLLEPIGNTLAAPFRNLGPGAAGLFAGMVRKFNPSWADTMQRYAEGDRPFAEIDRAFRDAISTATGAVAGRTLEARSAATAPAERQLRSIADRVRGAGWDLTRFANETLNTVGGTGPITYVQLLAAAQRLPIVATATSAPLSTTERTPGTRTLALDSHADTSVLDVVNADTLLFGANVINPAASTITVEGTTVTLAPGARAGTAGTAVKPSGAEWLELRLYSPTSPVTREQTFGKLEIRIVDIPTTRPITREIKVGTKSIKIRYP